MLTALLKHAAERKEPGVNVLLYGPPGTGKTELAKVCTAAAGLELYEVEYADRDGNSLSGRDRYRSLQISQVFLKGSGLAAVLLVAGLAVSSLRAAAWGVTGAAIAVLTAHGLGAESELVTGGLMGFSPVLTAIALGAVFHGPGVRAAAYAILGTIFTVLVQGAMNAVVTPFAIPTLTAPFVLVTWLFLLARPRLD